jgi:hypothetical protein
MQRVFRANPGPYVPMISFGSSGIWGKSAAALPGSWGSGLFVPNIPLVAYDPAAAPAPGMPGL